MHRRLRMLALLAACGACRPAPDVVPAQAPTPGPEQMPLVEGPHAAPPLAVSLCLLVNGEIARVTGEFDPASEDTILGGRPWREAAVVRQAPYAAGVDWVVRGEMLPLPGRSPLERYGLSRVFSPGELRRFGEYRGLPLFVDSAWHGSVPDVVYLFLRPGCEFQPYQQSYHVGAVRG